MKKKLSFLLVCLITAMMVINSSITAFAETYDNVDLISNYGVVIDYETGQVLGGKNIDSKVYPASTTKILNYREENGQFKSIEEIKNVNGIGEKKFENMKELICVK